MSRLEKHLGGGEPLKIGEDEFILKPLGVDSLPDFFKAMKAFSGAKEGAEMEDILKNIDEDGLQAIQRIIEKTLEISMPEEPEEFRKQFGLKYMGQLIGKIFEMNTAQDTSHEAVKKKATIEKMIKDRNVPEST